MKIGYVGLGKMGLNMILNLKEKGHTIIAFNRSVEPRRAAREQGVSVADSLLEMVESLDTKPRIVWLMVSHEAVDAVLGQLVPMLAEGDIIIDGGNSKYTETLRRAEELKAKGIHFVDAGVSGGPGGARSGACTMVGGDTEIIEQLKPLFVDMSLPDGFLHAGKTGAGHFVKMVHNGIEYGMMQAIAEGFTLMRESDFKLNLTNVAKLYEHGSVIESHLVTWLREGFEAFGEDLADVSGTVAQSGEGQWTVELAHKTGTKIPAIESALNFRFESQQDPSYMGKILSAIRNRFGGHSIGK